MDWVLVVANGLLVLVTWRYVVLTKRLADAASSSASSAAEAASAAQRQAAAAERAESLGVLPIVVAASRKFHAASSRGEAVTHFSLQNDGRGPAFNLRVRVTVDGKSGQWRKGPASLRPQESAGPIRLPWPDSDARGRGNEDWIEIRYSDATGREYTATSDAAGVAVGRLVPVDGGVWPAQPIIAPTTTEQLNPPPTT